MKILFKGGYVYSGKNFIKEDLIIDEGVISFKSQDKYDDIVDVFGKYIVPAFVDVHVHLREPGFSYKETIASGTMAAAKSGYCAVCSMPNLNPPPDSEANVKIQTDIIKETASINVFPFGTITCGRKGSGVLSDIEALAPYVIGYSDDGTGVQDETLMEEAMQRVKKTGKIISAHCEDNNLLNGGYIHDGEYAKLHGHIGISSESEWKQIERDIKLAQKTGCKYHVCHISTKESVSLIRNAKKSGVDITCETAPHYLLLCDEDMKESGAYKMNPPLRSRADKDALIEGIYDGTIDMIATDHAPHDKKEKNGGLKNSLMGIVGIETAFPVLYTGLVKTGIISFERLIELMSINPAKRFGIENGIEEGLYANIAVLDTESKYIINSEKFESKGKSTPFDGMSVIGENILTFVNGKFIWRKK